jgi:hypothetical protein
VSKAKCRPRTVRFCVVDQLAATAFLIPVEPRTGEAIQRAQNFTPACRAAGPRVHPHVAEHACSPDIRGLHVLRHIVNIGLGGAGAVATGRALQSEHGTRL